MSDAEDRLKWLQARQGSIGSSDAPCLIGEGWINALDIWRSKVYPVENKPPKGVLARGLALEEIVATLYEQATDTHTVQSTSCCHLQRNWQSASPDRERTHDGRLVELKTTAGFGGLWGESGSADVPPAYYTQVQHQLEVWGGLGQNDFADLAALDVIAWEFRVYRIPRDADYGAWLSDIEARFWLDHVRIKQPPGPEWFDQFRDRERDPSALKLDAEAGALLDKRQRLKDIAERAEDARKELDTQIESLLGAHKKATAPGWRVNRIDIATTSVPEQLVPASVKQGYSYLRISPAKEQA